MLGLGAGSGRDVPVRLRREALDQEVDEDAHQIRAVTSAGNYENSHNDPVH